MKAHDQTPLFCNSRILPEKIISSQIESQAVSMFSLCSQNGIIGRALCAQVFWRQAMQCENGVVEAEHSFLYPSFRWTRPTRRRSSSSIQIERWRPLKGSRSSRSKQRRSSNWYSAWKTPSSQCSTTTETLISTDRSFRSVGRSFFRTRGN